MNIQRMNTVDIQWKWSENSAKLKSWMPINYELLFRKASPPDDATRRAQGEFDSSHSGSLPMAVYHVVDSMT